MTANAWNAGSATLFEQFGMEAIATTSAGIAFSHGLPDYQAALPIETALEETREIVQAVDLPVSMDAENGYGHAAEAVFENMKRIAASGVVGAGIEDQFRRRAAREILDQGSFDYAAQQIPDGEMCRLFGKRRGGD